jgi:hypothetical protein
MFESLNLAPNPIAVTLPFPKTVLAATALSPTLISASVPPVTSSVDPTGIVGRPILEMALPSIGVYGRLISIPNGLSSPLAVDFGFSGMSTTRMCPPFFTYSFTCRRSGSGTCLPGVKKTTRSLPANNSAPLPRPMNQPSRKIQRSKIPNPSGFPPMNPPLDRTASLTPRSIPTMIMSPAAPDLGAGAGI